MDVSHNFKFRWNDHVPHLSQIFSELRFDEVYCDTTLISDDGYVLKAHGAVLSATSRYFERVLSDVTADQHPIIVLKGAYFAELSCLLDYIYEGVIQIDQHLMESVLDVADMLEIKGLSKMKNNLSIKKLIAPSPPSSVVSRSSPQCSSPSKSPTPPSQTPRMHSPSFPSSPNESYAPTSAMLKMDSEDLNEVSDPAQKKRLPFHDGKNLMGTSVMESKEYASNVTPNVPSHAPVCPSSDYSDQTLGIDLSLSRPTNEEGERSSVKNFSLHEDAPLRKRKILKYEEFSPSPNDLEWSKVGEKVKDSMPHKKKRFFTRSDEEPEPDCSLDSRAFRPSEYFVYEDTQGQRSRPSQSLDESEMWRHFKEERFGRDSAHDFGGSEEDLEDFKADDEYFHIDSDFYAESDGGGAAENEPSHPVSVSSNVPTQEVFIKQEPYLSTAHGSKDYGYRELSNSGPTSGLFHPSAFASRSEGSGSRGEKNPCHVWSHPGIVHVGGRSERGASAEASHGFQRSMGSENVSKFVSVKICKPSPARPSAAAKPQPLVEEVFRAINTKLKRPTQLIKRPLTKYTLFTKETYPVIAHRYPANKGTEIMKIVSSMWRSMTDEQKQPWEERANEMQREFKIRHPDYVFCPRTMQALKREYGMKRAERRNMFKINPSNIKTGMRDFI